MRPQGNWWLVCVLLCTLTRATCQNVYHAGFSVPRPPFSVSKLSGAGDPRTPVVDCASTGCIVASPQGSQLAFFFDQGV